MENAIEAPVIDDYPLRVALVAYIRLCIEKTQVGSPSKLAEQADLRPSTLNKFLQNWETWHLPSTRTLEKLAAYSGVDFVRPGSEHGARDIPDTKITQAPHITWEQAAKLVGNVEKLPFKTGGESVPVSHGRKSVVALEVLDNSVDRIAPKGSTVIIDWKDKKLRPGEPYAFKIKSKQFIRIYREQPIRLEPLSTETGHETFFPEGKPEVIGHFLSALVVTGKY